MVEVVHPGYPLQTNPTLHRRIDDATGNVPCPFKTAVPSTTSVATTTTTSTPTVPMRHPISCSLPPRHRSGRHSPVTDAVRNSTPCSRPPSVTVSTATRSSLPCPRTRRRWMIDRMVCYNCTKWQHLVSSRYRIYGSLHTFITNDGMNIDTDFLDRLQCYRDGTLCPGRALRQQHACDADVSEIGFHRAGFGCARRPLPVPHGRLRRHRDQDLRRSQIQRDRSVRHEPIWPSASIPHPMASPSRVRPAPPSPRSSSTSTTRSVPIAGSPHPFYGEGGHHNGRGYQTEVLERLGYKGDNPARRPSVSCFSCNNGLASTPIWRVWSRISDSSTGG